MSRLRWFFFFLSIAAGVGLGLYYGWVVNPVQYVNTSPASLRADFRTDYSLMVAEIYQHDHNIANAARQLANLGSTSAVESASDALIFAQQYKFDPGDIALLQDLVLALQISQPGTAEPISQPATVQP